jgi:histidine ammonia-lyase
MILARIPTGILAKAMQSVSLGPNNLSIGAVCEIANGAQLSLDAGAIEAADLSRTKMKRLAESDTPIYGVNTGFGALRSVRVDASDAKKLQLNLIRSHAVGVGPPLDRRIVRASLAILAASHLRGASGVGPEAALLCVELLNRDLIPVVPSRGSLGASGDLAPLAHLALALIGEAPVLDSDGGTHNLASVGLAPLAMEPKLGLSLINGTHVHTGIASLVAEDAGILVKAADIACAMAVEAMLCSNKPFVPAVHHLRPHRGQLDSAANIYRATEGSALIASHANCGEIQDAYSIRCAAQVHGASRQTLQHCREVVSTELASVTDNPLVIDDEVISAGHFHGEPVGLALDYLKIGLSELAGISERRSERALNPTHNRGLPAFLTSNPGLESGLMIAQYTAAALVSENKVLSHPSCVDSIATGANQEDHVSMAMNAALHAKQVADNVRRVLAIESIIMAQALDCRKSLQPDGPSTAVSAAYSAVRAQSEHVSEDRMLGPEVERFDLSLVVKAVEDAIGSLS